MAKQYVISKEQLGPNKLAERKSYGLDQTITRLRNRLKNHRGGGYKIRPEGGPNQKWSQKRNMSDTLTRVRQLLPSTNVGNMLRVKCLSDGVIFRVYTVETHVHAKLPSGAKTRWHGKIQHVYKTVFAAKWKNGSPAFWGAENCRLARQGTFWSMHSYWPPVLAIDIGCSNKALGDEIVAFLNKHIDGLVFVWWTNMHFDHIHVQVGSNRSGTPACGK